MLGLIHFMHTRLHTRLFAVVLLLPLVALATATGGVGLRCRITGELIDACCCDDGTGDAAKADTPATVSAADCCDRVVREVTSTTAEVSAPERLIPAHATPLPAFVLDISMVPADSSPIQPRSELRESIGPPTVRLRLLSKSTFLI